MSKKEIRQYALFLSHKYTFAVINTSLIILIIILMLFGGKNPSAVFALIFFNGLHLVLLSSFHSKKRFLTKEYDVPPSLEHLLPEKIDFAELAANQISLPVAVLLHLLLAFGFMYRMPLSVEYLDSFPLIMLSLILLTRYMSFLILKLYLSSKTKH